MAVIRTLLVVLLATALLTVSIPAIDTAREQRANDAAQDQLDKLHQSITTLTTSSEPVPPTLPGARRSLTLTVPTPSPGSVGVDWLAIGGVPNSTYHDGPHTDILAYRIHGGPVTVIRIDIDLRIVINGEPTPDSTPLLLQNPMRVVLTLVTDDPAATVELQPRHL